MKSKYDLFGHEYSIIRAHDKDTLCMEAKVQRNCLLSPVFPYLHNKTPILLLRKTSSLEVPFITISVSGNGIIREVRGKENRFAKSDVYLFLEAYSRFKGLKYDPASIILEDELMEFDETDVELSKYIYYYLKRKEFNKNECEMQNCIERECQKTLKDYFPEIIRYSSITKNEDPYNDCCGYDFRRIVDPASVPSNEIDRFIWDHLQEAYGDDIERKTRFSLQLKHLIKKKDVSYQTFQQLWKVSEAYDFLEVDSAILDSYKEYLSDDEMLMLRARW